VVAHHGAVAKLVDRGVVHIPPPILGDANVVFVVPAVGVVERYWCWVILLAVFLLVAVACDVLEHESEIGVRLVVELAVRAHVDAARVWHAAYPEVQVEALLVHVVGLDADVAYAALDLVICRRAVGVDRFALILDAADDAGEHLRGLVARSAPCGRDFYLRLILPGVIDDLEIVLADLVVCETRAAATVASDV